MTWLSSKLSGERKREGGRLGSTGGGKRHSRADSRTNDLPVATDAASPDPRQTDRQTDRRYSLSKIELFHSHCAFKMYENIKLRGIGPDRFKGR